MKIEVTAPDKGHKHRDWRFEALYVKRINIMREGFPEFDKQFYTIVENPIGTITIYRHGKTTDDVQKLLVLTEDGVEKKL
jgi:hypothetical protein